MKLIRRFLLIISCVLMIVGCVSCIRVNSKYPAKVTCQYYLGDIIDFEPYNICVSNAEIYKYWDFKEKYNYVDVSGVEEYVNENKTHIFLITLQITNSSRVSTKMPPISNFALQSYSGFSSNMDLYMLYSFHNNDIRFLEDELKPNETREVVLLYSIDAQYLSFYDSDMLQKSDFVYVFTLYPVKNYISFV